MTAARPAPPPGPGRFALWGAAGFGLGGVLCGLVQWGGYVLRHPPAAEAVDSVIASLGFGIMGGLGGVALGLAARDSRLLRRLLVTGVLGFGVGGLLNLVLLFASKADLSALAPVFPGGIDNAGIYAYVAAMYMLAFATRGAIGGAVLGLAVPHRHGVRFLALAGALGFGLGGVVGMVVLNVPGWSVLSLGAAGIHALWIGSSTAVGGAVLGAAVGSLVRPRS